MKTKIIYLLQSAKLNSSEYLKMGIFLFAILLSSSNVFSQDSDVLTNESVIQLTKAGFNDEVIKAKIQTSQTKFNTSTDEMLKLKNAGVSFNVINLMLLKPGSSIENKRQFVESGDEKKGLNLASGIYYFSPNSEYLEIEPSVLTSGKSNGAAQLFLSTLINSKQKATLSGNHSSFEISEFSPKFVFVFDTTQKVNLNNDNNQWFTNARSPKEFLLVKMNKSGNSREIVVGKANIVSSSSGIDDKYIMPFSIKKLHKGAYEIQPEKALSKGEYCIMFSQGIKKGESSKVFDFTIK